MRSAEMARVEMEQKARAWGGVEMPTKDIRIPYWLYKKLDEVDKKRTRDKGLARYYKTAGSFKNYDPKTKTALYCISAEDYIGLCEAYEAGGYSPKMYERFGHYYKELYKYL